MIGSGSPDFFEEFRRITKYKGKLFSDKNLQLFSLLGFKKSLGSLINLQTIFSGIKAAKSGYRQGTIQGDTLQIGGALGVDKYGKLLYYYKSNSAGDLPPVKELLDVNKLAANQ